MIKASLSLCFLGSLVFQAMGAALPHDDHPEGEWETVEVNEHSVYYPSDPFYPFYGYPLYPNDYYYGYGGYGYGYGADNEKVYKGYRALNPVNAILNLDGTVEAGNENCQGVNADAVSNQATLDLADSKIDQTVLDNSVKVYEQDKNVVEEEVYEHK